MELELRHLKVVSAIAEAGSLTRAATGLGLAQPALSAQLKRMERALGGALFVRGPHGVRPTELGELVLERARVLVPAVAELQEEARRLSRTRHTGRGGPVRFRLGGTHGPLLGGLVDRLASAHPSATVTTWTSWSAVELGRLVAEGRIDYALTGVCGQSPPPSSGTGERIVWRDVAVDPVFVMLREGHPLAGEEEVPLGALAEARWTNVPGDGCFAECFAAACARAGFTPRAVYEADTASCVHLVQVGRAVGLCRATFPPTPGLVTRPLAGSPLMWRHVLGWHPDSPAAHTARETLAHARAVHESAAGLSPSYVRWRRAHPAPAASPAP
ncbi:LysR family transcriptional regulator [Streptomyces albus subsp. chlorinus]|uniref:LysR family transcriptional regulator n=1 Tax=Streptomyces albus TaxID=1888 RepID=UPI00156DA62F|nr:LysR family transcriptional regulator [Streptomyces albus]NSC23127.1 LysR family transcriptional regulator [Streptomyces albus subsp. chlorinus]